MTATPGSGARAGFDRRLYVPMILGAILNPVNSSIIAARSPSTVLTALSVSAQTAAVVGPSLGGLLIGLGGWRTTFVINVPLAAACLALGARRLPRRPDEPGTAPAGRGGRPGQGW